MYEHARKQVRMSRFYAANELFIGNRTLQNYENHRPTPPPEIVVKMSQVYRNPLLRPYHCTKICPIGRIDLQPVDDSLELNRLVIRLIKNLEDLSAQRSVLVDVAYDGAVSNYEGPMFAKIIAASKEIEQTIRNLWFWWLKEKENAAFAASSS